MKLEELGFDDWFQKRWSSSRVHEYSVARLTAVNKDNYIIRNEEAEIPAEVTGKLMYGARSNLDLPAVGDWVCVQYFNENTLAIIHEILPRKSLLKRKVAGKKIELQLIASNIDFAFIMQSVEFDFNLRRLERYLIMANESHIKPVILLSKRDLISAEDLKKEIRAIKSTNPGYEIIAFSNKTDEGLEGIQKLLQRGKTYCLLGSSGVGKTTLINKLIGENKYATAAIREKDGRGRHVSARRQLVILNQGGMIIDTPGMRELGNVGVHTGLSKTFADIVSLAQDCRFKNCMHMDEPGCAVTEAVKKGKMPATRYQNYLKIRRESEFHEMSYLERRRRDKKFGKIVKSIMKDKKKEEME
ncbi:MAG: ribosome small subunit-dependent GTPase A [Candidatus Aminicenantes bacterium]|nr:MAG: ribosome small subunit-dependent GTPase A [Candidatus Aminicenantes bacterium]